MKRLLWGLAIAALLLTLGFFAAGGKQGVILLFVKYGLHREAAPTMDVTWQAAPPAATAQSGKRPPNILLIVADDLGYNDISLNGGGVAGAAVPTPNINSIAQNGIDFSGGYAGNATCSPSRAAMLTGRYPTRFGFEFTSVPMTFSRVIAGFKSKGLHPAIYHAEREASMPPYEQQGVPTSEISIARLLKQADYHTLHLGKWHMGENASMGPNAHGFDESLGFLQGAMMFLPADDPNVVNAQQDFDPIDQFLWAAAPFGMSYNNSEHFKPARYVTDYLTDEAVDAIKANQDRPFFMYLAYNAPHTPLQATREDYDALPQIEDHTRRVYAAMIRNLDRNIGRVLAELKAQGLDDNTLVIFTSDNGGANYIGLDGLNQPYRGWKATFFEGGTRVPFLMQWPGVIPAGSRFTQPVSHFDIFATAAAVAGVPLPTDRVIDGVDLLPYALGTQSGRPHPQMFWRSGAYQVARDGDWKLQVNQTRDKVWLFNLADDPTEQHDLAASQPEKVKALQAQLAEFNRQQHAPLWPALLEAPILIDKPLNRPQTAADEFIYWSN
ncbi:sulfatase-like hydrolase/transferase [Pseudomonas sp. N040]|uniref:sulfatase-like hydrolase/transferase n=1 Tax=Pseudomonas sp. N040 TaxID=2785325 RepID=UPI0018A27B5B|nr:sulfatase-like hydrolase/transferase [Pseudomonas sp. N040]MBF7731367.1 sulfatase-like hydrolase/transferase [Pseudomonas sp. N040]MBW7015010.1 sulfatase-like hydrolase/transferase [Pseudomonas sp. N040]